MNGFTFVSYAGDDAGDVLARIIAGGDFGEQPEDEPEARVHIVKSVAGFQPNDAEEGEEYGPGDD